MWVALIVVLIALAVASARMLYSPKNPMPSEDNITEIEFIPIEKEPETVLEPLKLPVEVPSRAEVLYERSKECIGQDLTPKDEVDDSVACVAQLQAVYLKAFEKHIGTGAALYNTKALLHELFNNLDFKEVQEATPGCIVVYATGTATKASNVSNGHCFVVGKHQWMSNDSDTGKWNVKYTEKTAKARYEDKGGYPRFTFLLLDTPRAVV